MHKPYAEGDEPVPGSGYRLVRFLGRGHFGEVWKATTPGGAEAALKIIALGGREGRKELRALQLVKRIRHPNLVPIIAFWLKTEDGRVLDDMVVAGADPAALAAPVDTDKISLGAALRTSGSRPAELIIAMGLGDVSLYDRLEQCRAEGLRGLPIEELLRYMEDAAEALDFLNKPLHDVGSGPVAIQHCDVKPHNLMIVGGAVQVCDFGLARVLGTDRTTTAAATIAYAAPECLITGNPSATTDEYCLAVTYYELRTGVLPYADETLGTVMDAKRKGSLDFSRVSAAEQRLLRRATSCDPEERFPSVGDLVRQLGQACEATAGPTQLFADSQPAPHARRPLKALLKIALLLAVVAMAGYGLHRAWPWILPPAPSPPEPGNVGPPDPGPKQPVPPTVPTVAELLAQAETQQDAQLIPEAIETYGEAIRLDPNSAPAYLGRACCRVLLQPSDYDGAIADYEQASALDPAVLAPQLAVAFFLRGKAALERKDSSAAVADFERAMLLDENNVAGFRSRPEYAEAYSQVAVDHLGRKEYSEAIEVLERALQYAADGSLRAKIYSRLGSAYANTERSEDAVASFTEALALEENDLDYVSRGTLYLRLDPADRTRANADFDSAIRLNPGNGMALYYRAAAYAYQDDLSEADRARAIDLLTRLIEVYPDQGIFPVPLYEVYYTRGEFQEPAAPGPAAADYAEAAALCHRDGRRDEALECMDKAIEAAPPADAPRYQALREQYAGAAPP